MVVTVGTGRGLGEVLEGGEESVECGGGEALVARGVKGSGVVLSCCRGVVAIGAEGLGKNSDERCRGGVEVGEGNAPSGLAKSAGMPRVRKSEETALPVWNLSAAETS